MGNAAKSSLRLFFALWPDASVRGALAAWRPPLRELCDGRKMRPETLHLTLVFLGDVAERRLEALCLAAQEVQGEPFDLTLDAARYWGHNHIAYAAPSVIPPSLAALVRALEGRLRAHRFHFDRRDHRPHVTLLRHAKWSDAPLPVLPPVHWPVRRFVLVRSLRDEAGAGYEVLAEFPLE